MGSLLFLVKCIERKKPLGSILRRSTPVNYVYLALPFFTFARAPLHYIES